MHQIGKALQISALTQDKHFDSMNKVSLLALSYNLNARFEKMVLIYKALTKKAMFTFYLSTRQVNIPFQKKLALRASQERIRQFIYMGG